ncbi:hypothetical protein GX48_07565 [Paracoccidioides brasiliensis]|nr:hypothetical protein GX48_07565 [Paracoccidioides brasiliensis]
MDKAARAAQRQIDKELRDEKKAQEQKEKEERAASPARVPTDPLPEGYDDIAISTGLMTACSLNLPPPKISCSGRVIKPNKRLLN